jgi:hypothetical protein
MSGSLVHAKHAVRAQALDRERTGYADLLLVLVGLVVEVLELGLGGDGLVDLLLAGDAGLPPFRVQLLRGIWPFGIGVARNLPLLSVLPDGGVQPLA